MTEPTEPGWYWCKAGFVHRPRGWFPVRVVRQEDGLLYADDGRHVWEDGQRWGPRIHEPEAPTLPMPDEWVWSDTLPAEKHVGVQAVGPDGCRAWTVEATVHPALPGNAFLTYDDEEIQSTPIPVVLAVLRRGGHL